MANHKKSFFIEQGPEEVDFDMDSVFIRQSVTEKVVHLHSKEIKDLLGEQLLKLDYSLKQRHGELVDYLKKVEDRISRVEDELLGHNFSSSSLEFDNSNFKKKSTDFIVGSRNDSSLKCNEFSDLVKKENNNNNNNNLPNVSLDQEELDALLGGLNEISINDAKDNRKSFDNSNALKNDSDTDVYSERITSNESSNLDVSQNLFSESESDVNNVIGDLLDTENVGSLNGFGVSDVTINSNDVQSKDMTIKALGDDKALENMLVDMGSVSVDSEINDNSHLDNLPLSDNYSDLMTLQEGSGVSCDVEDNLKKTDDYLNNGNLIKIQSLDKDLYDMNIEESKEKDDKGNNFSEIALQKINSVSSDLDMALHKGSDSIDDDGLNQNQEIDNVSFALNKFDNFEDVLKADLECLDLQGHIKDLEEENLYDNHLVDSEEKLEQDEKLDSSFLKEQTEGMKNENVALDFSFADVETIINKFNDSDYLSKINLSNEERDVLVKFISKLEEDMESKSESNNFTIKKEYEILQKIKHLLVRE
ncbi:hypothetical protein [Borrelia sp. HM]|uniref:hypothetical protein n=1 Tax=Borrelia sp. HM TaxID=1882662 RepID=UPI001C77E3C0|nr:hypothetical protein [Borrelia sp. HM]BCR22158.1 hypothetical protein BKFM_00752 [Borrelia sp. HM]